MGHKDGTSSEGHKRHMIMAQVSKLIRPFEIRIGWDCPACGQKGWIANFTGDFDGYGQCAWCNNWIMWKLIVERSDGPK